MFMRQSALVISLVTSATLLMPIASATVAPATTPTPVTTPAVTPTAQTPTTATASNTTVATDTPPLRQNQTAAPLAPNLVSLQQKHKLEMAEQEKRLSILEQANQEALAKNQELQINNDSLAVQIQVLQSERSAQMFLYGAVTFGVGIFFGIIIYSVLNTRRRRSW